MHLICEAGDDVALSRGIQGLSVRTAKAINRVIGAKGTVFDDRYRVTLIKTPEQMRKALALILLDAPKRGSRMGAVDPFSSADFFDGFAGRRMPEPREPIPVAPAKSALLKKKWRALGLLKSNETPPASWP